TLVMAVIQYDAVRCEQAADQVALAQLLVAHLRHHVGVGCVVGFLEHGLSPKIKISVIDNKYNSTSGENAKQSDAGLKRLFSLRSTAQGGDESDLQQGSPVHGWFKTVIDNGSNDNPCQNDMDMARKYITRTCRIRIAWAIYAGRADVIPTLTRLTCQYFFDNI